MMELQLVPEHSMHFRCFGHAGIAALFSQDTIPFL